MMGTWARKNINSPILYSSNVAGNGIRYSLINMSEFDVSRDTAESEGIFEAPRNDLQGMCDDDGGTKKGAVKIGQRAQLSYRERVQIRQCRGVRKQGSTL